MEIQATLARAQSSERQVIELEKELSAQRQKASAARASQKEELNALRAEVERERRERSQLVLAMRESLGGLKEAGDKESKLKSDLLRAQEQLAAAQAAESAASTLAEERRSGLMDAVADIRHLQVRRPPFLQQLSSLAAPIKLIVCF